MSIWIITLYGFLIGSVGTALGGVISIFIKTNKKVSSFLLGITGGFMLSIVTFKLISESFLLAGINTTIIGTILGVLIVIFAEMNIYRLSINPIMVGSLLHGISIAIHNFPEGLALGSSFFTTTNLGPVLALAMLLHNIPEGLSMAIPLRINRIAPWKIIFYTSLIGVPTGIGAYLGAYVGMISPIFIALCLSFAGGAMLYIITDEIIPNAKTMHKGRASSIGVAIGFMIGMIL